jgi:phytoene synthase
MTPKAPAAAAAIDSEQKVKRSSFYPALRILPLTQRHAMFAIYAFCREVDDIADDRGQRAARQSELRLWRDEIDALYQDKPSPRTQNLVAPIRQFGLRRVDFQAIIDGMEMDVAGDAQAPDWATLDLYCDRVASAVGRLSVRVFGLEENDGLVLSHHLGRALQLTNILRDIDEDAEIGRLYLPREPLLAAGIAATEPSLVVNHPAIGASCAPLIAKARAHFAEAEQIMARVPRNTIRTPMLMCKAYQLILAGLIARGFAPPRTPVRIGKMKLALLLLRYGIF